MHVGLNYFLMITYSKSHYGIKGKKLYGLKNCSFGIIISTYSSSSVISPTVSKEAETNKKKLISSNVRNEFMSCIIFSKSKTTQKIKHKHTFQQGLRIISSYCAKDSGEILLLAFAIAFEFFYIANESFFHLL